MGSDTRLLRRLQPTARGKPAGEPTIVLTQRHYECASQSCGPTFEFSGCPGWSAGTRSQAKMSRLASASATNASTAACWRARICAMNCVPTLPTASRMTLGGAPYKKLSCRKSSSFDTMTKPCWAAYRQIF